MSTAEAPSRLFGIISMTSALWFFVMVQVGVTLAAFGLCVLPVRSRLAARRLARGGTAALLVSIAVSAITYLSGLLRSFAADGPPEVKAAELATGILTMMHVRWMCIPFVVLIGISMKIQDARRRSLAEPSAGARLR